MNKKIISILLIFTMVLVGFSSLAAEEVNDSNSQTNTQDSQAVSTSSSQSESNQTVAETTNNTTTNNTTTANATYEKQNDEKVYDLIKSLNDNQRKKLLDLLTEMKVSDYNDLIQLLKNKNMNETDFYKALGKLNDNEFYSLYLIANDIHSQKDTVIKKDDLTRFPTPIKSTVTKITSDDSKKASDNSIFGIFSGSSKSDSYKLTVADKYAILNDLMKGYLAGTITFDDFKFVLTALGFDTNGMKLNPDGSITWNGIVIPGPANATPATNTNSTNTTNTTNTTSDASTGSNASSSSAGQASSDSSSSGSSSGSSGSGSSSSSSDSSSSGSSSGSSSSGSSSGSGSSSSSSQ